MVFGNLLALLVLLLTSNQLCSISSPLAGRHLLSIQDLSKEEIELVLDTAEHLKKEPNQNLLKGCILATCFFEPSTRTRFSFESAMHRLGGSVIGFADPTATSVKKGETLFDTIKTISKFADAIVIRHPVDGSALIAAEASDVPILNGGDGSNQHPTQALLDLFTIRECQGKLDDLHIAFVGDLKHGRTIHSLCQALTNYQVRLYFVSPEALPLPKKIQEQLEEAKIPFSFHDSIEEVIPLVDILYMTRIQKERFVDPNCDFNNPCILKYEHLKNVRENLKILHPLPRIDEIERTIDSTPYAHYFDQLANGVSVRMALLLLILGKD